MFGIISQETDKSVKDNVIAAVCRMLTAHIEGVPVDQVGKHSCIDGLFQIDFLGTAWVQKQREMCQVLSGETWY